MKKLNLNENFICRIWEDKTFYNDLKTNDGRDVEILDHGKRNRDSGPDYSDAKIKIDGNLLAGSVEIHRTANDWYLHRHQDDGKYNDVILHVVLYSDLFTSEKAAAVTGKSRQIPTVVLSEFLSRSIHSIWRDIIDKPSEFFKLPCFPKNEEMIREEKLSFIMDLGLERLKQKSVKFSDRIKELSVNTEYNNPDSASEQVLFEYLCEALGYSKNKEQFISLSRRISIESLRKTDPDRIQTDSIIFGLSGFLSDLKIEDEYSEMLFCTWTGLRGNIRKEEMMKSEWNFFRLRPPNFPTLRLAYAAGLLYEITGNGFVNRLISEFESSSDILKSMNQIFTGIKISQYWRKHYNFGKPSKSENKGIGSDRIKDIISNVVFPFMYQRSRQTGMENLLNKVKYFYRNNKQKAPVNEVSKVMQEQLGVNAFNPASEQGLIHLHNFFCMKGKCSECKIGRQVFEEGSVHEPLRIIIY